VADAEMTSVDSPSTSRLKDSGSSATSDARDQSPTGEYQLKIENTSGETGSDDTGSENELKHDGSFVKKPKLELTSSHSNIEDESGTMKEPKREPETDYGSEDVAESMKNKRPRSGVDEESKSAAKKPRLDADGEDDREPSDRQRNKSTSAAVLLGLVKSRVRKLAAERIERKAASSGAVVSSNSQTSNASSATSSPKIGTPPGECLPVYAALFSV